MQNETWTTLLMLGIGLFVAKLWLDDFKANRTGKPNTRALPGVAAAPWRAILIAALGGFALVATETWGELRLGIAGEQSKMTMLFAGYTLVAAVVEEVVFRGYIFIDKKGPLTLWVSVLAASVLFALFHPFLWHWNDGHLTWTFTVKGWYSTSAIFLGSLWFYYVRFSRFNPERSLLPCFAAHASKNLGVILFKAAQGFLVGGW